MSDVDPARARCDAATPGPWDTAHRLGRTVVIDVDGRRLADGLWHDEHMHSADAEFIAHARTDLPAALDEVERLRAENERLTIERDHAQQMGASLYWDTVRQRDALRAKNADMRAALDRVNAMLDESKWRRHLVVVIPTSALADDEIDAEKLCRAHNDVLDQVRAAATVRPPDDKENLR